MAGIMKKSTVDVRAFLLVCLVFYFLAVPSSEVLFFVNSSVSESFFFLQFVFFAALCTIYGRDNSVGVMFSISVYFSSDHKRDRHSLVGRWVDVL